MKNFCAMSDNDEKRECFSQPNFNQNVPMDTQNAVLTTPLEDFDNQPGWKFFTQRPQTSKKTHLFSEEKILLRDSSDPVQCTIDRPAENSRQKVDKYSLNVLK